MIKNEPSKTTYRRRTIQQFYENDSKEMLNTYFHCPLSILLSMQCLAFLLNTTDNDVRKV